MLILFNDNLCLEKAPFSIQNIVPEAYDSFDIKPGEWFRATSIMLAIEKLNYKYKPALTQHIEMITFVESIIYVNVLYERLILSYQPYEDS
jgi:Peptidase family C54